jgi:hypothetical protein
VTVRYDGPCKIDCPLRCDVPDHITMQPVPHNAANLDDAVICPNLADCDRAFLRFDRRELPPSVTLDDLTAAAERIAAGPPPARTMEVSELALERLRADAPEALSQASPMDMFGITLVQNDALPAGAWRMLDADGHVISEGLVKEP